MSSLKSAQNSPRLVNDIIYWHEGDTFAIELTLTLTDSSNNGISLDNDKQIIVNIYRNDIMVHRFCFSSFPNGNVITLNFDSEVTKKFPFGKYVYDILYIDSDITTIVANNIMEVEK